MPRFCEADRRYSIATTGNADSLGYVRLRGYFGEIDNRPECVCSEQPAQIEIYSIDHGQWLPNHNLPPVL